MSKKYLFYSIKIQPQKFAKNETTLRETAVAERYLYGNLPQFIRRYEEILNGRYHSWKEHCINNTRQYVAIVHFHIAPSANDLINKIVKTPRVTYADILSNIGKYVMFATLPDYKLISH